MPVTVQWINHASFRIEGDDAVIYIDPWKIEGEPHDADVVFVSHEHYDHCSPADVERISKDDTAVCAPADTIVKLHARNAVTPGETLWFRDVQIEGIAAYNIGKAYHPKSKDWVGAILTIDGKRIYYAGDTDLTPEMSKLAGIDLALLPVGGTYTLDALQAAEACRAIGCAAAVPYHWGDIVGEKTDAELFAEKADCRVHVLRPGESVEL
jgi:L-ascorbate metabolism protein UlaG (beta-lactamase superfamily)